MSLPPNLVAAQIALAAPAPPDQRVRVQRSQMPAASLLTAPALGQRRRDDPAQGRAGGSPSPTAQPQLS